MSQHLQKSDKASKFARAWLIFISLIAAALCIAAILGVAQISLWLTVAFGVLAVGAMLLAIVAPPHIRRAFAEFFAWPWG